MLGCVSGMKFTILSGGSLGSWIDEKRSKLRELMWIADTLNIDILNAHCGVEFFSSPHLSECWPSIFFSIFGLAVPASDTGCSVGFVSCDIQPMPVGCAVFVLSIVAYVVWMQAHERFCCIQGTWSCRSCFGSILELALFVKSTLTMPWFWSRLQLVFLTGLYGCSSLYWDGSYQCSLVVYIVGILRLVVFDGMLLLVWHLLLLPENGWLLLPLFSCRAMLHRYNSDEMCLAVLEDFIVCFVTCSPNFWPRISCEYPLNLSI